MDIEGWQAAIRQRLGGLTEQVRRRTPGAVYGALSAATALPIVAAVTQGDFGALGLLFSALANTAGGIGGNLIAHQLQAWKDRSQAEVAAELQHKASEDAQWRAALDALLQALDTPRLACAGLSADDRAWLVQTLNGELATLGSDLRVQGDGAIVVTGERNITVGGDMTGNLNVTGDNATVIIAERAARDLLPGLSCVRLSPDRLQEVAQEYLAYLLTSYRYLELKGMGIADRVALRLPLDEMYVPLKARIELPRGETWAREMRLAGRKVTEEEAAMLGERLSAPQPLLDLLGRYDGLVILGDPGAGKSTFVKYLALRLARGEGEAVGLAGRLPILVPLSAYANALAQDRGVPLQRFLGDYFQGLGSDLPVGALLDGALAEGRALVLFDGLDEVQDLQLRTLVVDRVVKFFALHRRRGAKFILTSRIVGYREARPTADGLGECTLADFDDDDIADFVGRWTRAVEQAAQGEGRLATVQAERERADLLDAIHRNPRVRQLATNPLLLTILALMKRANVTLPERRVELYEQYVKTLLKHWNLARGLDPSGARDLDVVETVRALAPLALWMQETSPGRGLVKREGVRRELELIYRRRGEADPVGATRRFLADVHDYTSLLLERGPGEYGFIHLTFQEYLAAVALVQAHQRDPTPIADLLAETAENPSWREVALLAVGYLGIVQQRDEAAGDVVLRLLETEAGEPGATVVLAGEAVVDAWPGGVTPRCRETVRAALERTMLDDQKIAAPVRAAAGNALARLGDTRPGVGVGVRDGQRLPDIAWSEVIPPEPFLMGSDPRKDKDADKDEQPQFTCRLITRPYQVSRYPVTVAQYRLFIEAGGYQNPDYWTEARQANRWRSGRFRAWDDAWADGPADYGEPFSLDNHPQVGVSWYEAMAFCRWLSERLGREVRLPTEAEWERAARGTDGRIYPWGDDFDAGRFNMVDTGIGATSAVGLFPSWPAPCGAADMVGNVWEWLSTPWLDSYRDYERRVDDKKTSSNSFVVRGGAWDYAQGNARCAARGGDVSYGRNLNLGFRVILAPPTSRR